VCSLPVRIACSFCFGTGRRVLTKPLRKALAREAANAAVQSEAGVFNIGLRSKFLEPTPAEPFERVRRSGDLLHYHIGSTYHRAKASLSRLLQQFENKVHFVVITSYRRATPEKENIKTFQEFPREYRALVGTMKIGAYELAGHWQEEGGEDAIERSWFFTKGDPNLSSEDFIGAGQKLAIKYEQDAIIVSRQGVVTLETPAGEVWATLTTAGAIENALLKLMNARSEFAEGKLEGVGFSELKRLKEKKRDSTFYFDNAEPDSGNDWLNEGLSTSGSEGAKTSSVKPGIFVTVPVNNFSKWAFSTIGLNWPDWK
jgi:hypothetical protein